MKRSQSNLDKITEWKRLDRSDFGTFSTRCLEEISILGRLGLTLQVHLDTSLGSFYLGCFILLDTLQNFLLALGFSYMLNAHMNTLFNDTSIHQLVDTNTNSRLGDIKDNTRTTMVTLVRHTLVNGRVGENVHIVAHLDAHQILRKVNGAMLTELLGKHVARARSDTVRVRHVGAVVAVLSKKGGTRKEMIDTLMRNNNTGVDGALVVFRFSQFCCGTK